MAIKPPSVVKAADASKAEAPSDEASSSQSEGAPKKKRKYSRNAGPAQRFELRVSKSARKISRAVKKGIGTYLDERDKSRDRYRDGALIESYVNVAKGLSDGIKIASPAISGKDWARGVNSKRTRRVIRSVIRSLPFPFPR